MAWRGVLSFGVLVCWTVTPPASVSAADTTPSAQEGNRVDGIYVGQCSFPTHKEWSSEQKAALWSLNPLMGKSFDTDDSNLPKEIVDGQEPSKVYKYSVGVCAVPNQSDVGTPSVTAVFQYDGDTQYVLGQLNNTAFMSGTDWAMLEYKGGKSYKSHCNGQDRKTIVMIICAPGDKQGHLKIIEENNKKTEDCFYLFELSHESACSKQNSGGLSIGSIVCIIFFSLVAVYLIGGFIYQRFIVGAKGLEQIPHLHFWRDFGNLQADGCDLLCRCGFQRSTRTYRGVGDDQLTAGGATIGDDDDDNAGLHDDHLLPM